MGVSSAENLHFQDYLHAPKQLGVWLPGDRRQMAFPKYHLVTHTKAFTGTCTKKLSVLISGIPWAWWELVGVWMCMSVPSSALLALLGLRAASKELWQHTQKHTHTARFWLRNWDGTQFGFIACSSFPSSFKLYSPLVVCVCLDPVAVHHFWILYLENTDIGRSWLCLWKSGESKRTAQHLLVQGNGLRPIEKSLCKPA